MLTTTNGPCPFKRCEPQDVHCNGACHGKMPDGTPLLELLELASHIDESMRLSCQGERLCNAGPFCVALEDGRTW